MASSVLTNCMVLQGTAFSATPPGPGNPTVAGTITSPTDWSDHTRQIQLNHNVAMPDMTTFGDGGFTTTKPGLKDSDITITLNQDFVAASIDAVFGAAALAGTLLYLDIKPTNAARGANNPSYVYAVYVSNYPPIGQSVGDAATVAIGFKVTGTFARLTS